MKEMILIPKDQYYKMLQSFDEAMKELHEIKDAFEKYQNSIATKVTAFKLEKPLQKQQLPQRQVTQQSPQKPDWLKYNSSPVKKKGDFIL